MKIRVDYATAYNDDRVGWLHTKGDYHREKRKSF